MEELEDVVGGRGELRRYLSVSHNDDGTLKPGPVQSALGGFVSAPEIDANRGRAGNVVVDPTSFLSTGIPTALTFPTGYAGNDVVEPSILYDDTAPFFADANGRNGYEYVACIGGYSGSNALYENPNLWVSHDGTTWVYVVFSGGVGIPTPGYGGVLTPIVPSAFQGDGLLSDPYLVRGPDGTFFILWNQFLVATGSGGTGTDGHDWSIKGISASSLAGPWSTPVTLVASTRASVRPSSPSAVWDGTQWQVYCVDLANTSATFVSEYTIADKNLLSTWVAKSNPSISLPSAYSSQVWWHHNVYRVGNQLLILMQDTAAGTSGGGNLWLLSSTDNGATWTVPPSPFLAGSSYYRSALVVSQRGSGLGLDLFLGENATSWKIRRGYGSFRTNGVKYGGIDDQGRAIHAVELVAAKIPLAPYLFGDTVIRADSATSPGTADSGQAYTVSIGTMGVSSDQLYSVVAGNCRAAVALTGCADGLYAAVFSAIATTASQFLIGRYVDASNYVRVGYNDSALWRIENIVAGGVSQSQVFSPDLSPAAGDVVAMVCNGSTITVYVNGIVIGQVTGWASNQAGSGIGVQYSAVNAARTRNLLARPLVGGQ